MELSSALKDLSHHAYCIVGEPARLHGELAAILEKRHKVRFHGNPDLFDRACETFAIDDARELKAFAETKPVDSAGSKVCLVATGSITVEAQNALLKLLEEPPEYARFFLIVPSAHLLLPTVKSRLATIEAGETDVPGATGGSGEIGTIAREFLRLAPAKRFDMVKKFMDEVAKEKRSKQDAIDLLNAIEREVHAAGAAKNADRLDALELARTYMHDRSPSLKMLLEYVALSV